MMPKLCLDDLLNKYIWSSNEMMYIEVIWCNSYVASIITSFITKMGLDFGILTIQMDNLVEKKITGGHGMYK